MNCGLFIVLLCVFGVYGSNSKRIQVCDEHSSVDISTGIPMKNGDIYYKDYYYSRDEYYIDENGKERGCICSKITCIRKCCPFGFGYNIKKKSCDNVREAFKPPVWDIISYRVLEDVNATSLFHFIPGKMNCTAPKTRRIPISPAADLYHLRMDGKLFIMISGNIPPWLILGPENYCIDTFVHEDSSGERTTQLDALICFAEKQEENHYVLSFTCMIISCVFILATCAVYAWLPELRNLHGRVLMAYLLCLFVAFAFMATMQIMLTIDNISSNACAVLTFIIYYWLLVAFFWLNVMCFDIWWTFSGKRGMSLEKLSIRARFLAYSAYAFSIPTALTILLAALEFSGLPSHPLLPMIRQQGCFIYGTSKLIYLYGPIVVLCVANLIFFVLTAVKITQIKRQTSVLKSKESSMHDQHRNDKQRFLLYVKLFAVMGINWILEVLSAIYPDPNEFWRFTDAYNVLIGVIIFIIFVCKRKIFRLIKKRIKETYHRSTNDEEMKRFGNTKRNGQRTFNQTSRSDTIRTTVGIDTNSIKSSTQL
ncbi:probable G-protein coupled receptor Mth-like 3 isoform X1 [Manduca sexta]|uniref:probable G-protein coupled receptor Mth-like 3 isoform X1 n=1 Tax=Manduca sexta TaxID=7130 RepID=UPI00189075A2|nr:probable G-protein coupled receptor Mth-like 3 isoform X1 [Manduca sexta]